VDKAGHAKLADFGLSVILIEGDMTATTSGGTYRWSAPELFVEGDVHRKSPSDIYSFGCACLEVDIRLILHELEPANMKIEAHTRKPPFATIRNDFVVMRRIMDGEQPCWPDAPSQGYEVSSSVKQLSKICWNSDPARRPTAEVIVKALAFEIGQDVIVPQVPQPPPLTSNAGISALQESPKQPTSLTYEAVTRDRASTTTVAGRRVNDGFGTSKLLKQLAIMEQSS
jgi:serine/threonine protein kinase